MFEVREGSGKNLGEKFSLQDRLKTTSVVEHSVKTT